MRFLTLLLILTALISVVSGHARIRSPKPLAAPVEDANGNAYNAPLSPSGSDFPCKGLHKKAGVDKTPTQTWQAGSMAAFEILGHGNGSGEGALAAHSGGSCQASLSFDNGVTWKALHSYEGGCPRGCTLGSNMAGPNQTFPFMVPAAAKSGNALFAWTWTAVSGNRDEFYMNCASVKITGSGTSTLNDYPDMHVGDMSIPGQIGTGECRSTAGNALLYPNPGPSSQVTQTTVSGIPFKKPTNGQCFAPGSASSGSGSSVVSPSLEPSTVAMPSSATYPAVGTTSYPVVQPSSYGVNTGYQASKIASIATSQAENPTSYPLMQPDSTGSPNPTDQGTSYSFANGYTKGGTYSRGHTKGGHGSSLASDYSAQATSGYPITYTMTTMLTYTTPAASSADSPTPQTSAYYAQQVSSPVSQSPLSPSYGYKYRYV